MRLRHFLDAAYALLHEEYQRYRMNMFEASEQLREFAAGYKPVDESGNAVSLSDAKEARENQRALAELADMMKNTGIAFP